VIGFAVIGYELANPSIKNRLKSRGAQRLFLSMEAASKALPVIIAHLPGPALFFTRPRAVFVYLINKTANWLLELEASAVPHHQLILITGAIHAGKTSLLRRLLPVLHARGMNTGGFVCSAFFENNQRSGYDITDTYETQMTMLSRKGLKSGIQIGNYYMSQTGFDVGLSLLQEDSINGKQLVVIDEIGPWELTGHGWARELPRLLQKPQMPMIWVVRKGILQAVIERWNIKDPLIIDVDTENKEDVALQIALRIEQLIKPTAHES
jgi:nucleoside-triphosphatase THEP1